MNHDERKRRRESLHRYLEENDLTPLFCAHISDDMKDVSVLYIDLIQIVPDEAFGIISRVIEDTLEEIKLKRE